MYPYPLDPKDPNQSNQLDDKSLKEIEKLLNKPITDKPYDNLISNYVRTYPQTNHILLGLPGEFDDIEDTTVIEKGETKLQCDFVQSTRIINGVFEYVTIVLEHQSTELDDNKIKTILRYLIEKTIMFKRPCHIYILTGQDYPPYKDFTIDYYRFSVNFIVYDEDKIQKTLNTLSNKDYSKEELSEVEFLDFLYCIILANRDIAKEVIKKSITIFDSMKNINEEYKREIYFTLTVMIRHHFKNDENKKRELITMIVKSSGIQPDKYYTYENTVLYGKKLQTQYDEATAKITELNDENIELTNKNTELTNENTELIDENKRFRKLLKLHGIDFDANPKPAK